MFDDVARDMIDKLADQLNVEAACLMAVIEVESGGQLYARVAGKNEPLIRFEGHYFDRLLPATKREKARKLGLTSPKAGRIRNPTRQADRWKLLHRAIELNREAALSSCSWGVGQVMGAHWKWLGYGSVDALVAQARSGAAGQIELMARYIEKAGLVAALCERDWSTFARLYNGPSYAKFAYDKRMAAAYRKHAMVGSEQKLPAPNLVPPGSSRSEPSKQIPSLTRSLRAALLSIFKRMA